MGEYVLGREDFLGALFHDDDIALCGAPLEDHGSGDSTRWEYVGGRAESDSAVYGIPFRTLVPQSIDGLLVAGRCFSATHEAHASARSIGQCMAMGQAAGTAAALAVSQDVRARDLDTTLLRASLSSNGAIL